MKKTLIFVISILGFALFIYFNLDQTKAGTNDPGTVTDPLVTRSYVDEMRANIMGEIEVMLTMNSGVGQPLEPANMTEIYSYIDEKMADVKPVDGSVFVVVQATAGQKIICEESSEVILRSGEVTVIGNATGDGITDVTAGQDLKNGQSVGMNHLCIVPRTDGRGFLVVKSCYIMIKGKYVIE